MLSYLTFFLELWKSVFLYERQKECFMAVDNIFFKMQNSFVVHPLCGVDLAGCRVLSQLHSHSPVFSRTEGRKRIEKFVT